MKCIDWQKDLPLVAPFYRSWLALDGSLTRALQRTGREFSVRVLDFSQRLATADEAPLFAPADNLLWCRQVLLCLDERPMIYAASLCAAQDAFWHPVLDRGGRSLGLTLFDEQHPIARTPLRFCQLALPDPRAQAAWAFFPECASFPARRALFFAPNSQNSSENLSKSSNSKLLVQELFLPPLSEFEAK